MKTTGFIGRLDDLGRIYIPKELRRSMGIQENEALEIFAEDDNSGLILIPYRPNYIQALRVVRAEVLGVLGPAIDWEDSEALDNAFNTIEKIIKKVGD